MKISLDWLSDFVNLEGVSATELADRLSLRTAEVEGVSVVGESLSQVVVGEVLSCEPHPEADRLSVTQVAFGADEAVPVVCGAPNVRKGLKVAFAPIGSCLPGDLKIKKAKLRGVESFGMICSASELELADDQEGILELEDTAAVGVGLVEHLELADSVLELDNKSLTHRPDLWGHWGMAREVAAIWGRSLKGPALSPTFSDNAELPRIEIQDAQACPYYAALRVDLKGNPRPSPAWMARRLRAVGQRPIHDVVDLTNYILLEIGQPTHAFDADRVAGDALLVRSAENGEVLTTLDGQERSLACTDLLIADSSGPLALAGVMGGLSSEVHDGTTTLLLESAHFDAVRVRRSAARFGLRTEASTRFEKSLDPSWADLALRRFTHILAEIRPEASVAASPSWAGCSAAPERELALDPIRTASLLGLPSLSLEKITEPLQALGFGVREQEGSLLVSVPSWRASKDITQEVDLVEEVGRLSGYENIDPRPLERHSEFHLPEASWVLQRLLGRRLAGAWRGYETESYSFLHSAWATRLSLEEDDFLHLCNPVQDEVHLIRRDPIPSLLDQAAANLREHATGCLFEFAKGYEPDGETPQERSWLGVVMWGEEARVDGPGSFFGRARSVAEDLFIMAGVKAEPESGRGSFSWAHPVRSLSWQAQGVSVAVSGCPDPGLLAELGLRDRAWGLLLVDLAAVIGLHPSSHAFQAPPRFPGIKVDIALSLPRELAYAEVESAVRLAGGNLLESVQLFDLFEGDPLPPTHRSLGFRVLLRTAERTLEEKDERLFLDRVGAAALEMGGQLRA